MIVMLKTKEEIKKTLTKKDYKQKSNEYFEVLFNKYCNSVFIATEGYMSNEKDYNICLNCDDGGFFIKKDWCVIYTEDEVKEKLKRFFYKTIKDKIVFQIFKDTFIYTKDISITEKLFARLCSNEFYSPLDYRYNVFIHYMNTGEY